MPWPACLGGVQRQAKRKTSDDLESLGVATQTEAPPCRARALLCVLASAAILLLMAAILCTAFFVPRRGPAPLDKEQPPLEHGHQSSDDQPSVEVEGTPLQEGALDAMTGSTTSPGPPGWGWTTPLVQVFGDDAWCRVASACAVECVNLATGEPGETAANFVRENQPGCSELVSLTLFNCAFPEATLTPGWLPLGAVSLRRLTLSRGNLARVESGAFADVRFLDVDGQTATLQLDRLKVGSLEAGVFQGAAGVQTLLLTSNPLLSRLDADLLLPLSPTLTTLTLIETPSPAILAMVANVTSHATLPALLALDLRFNEALTALPGDVFGGLPRLRSIYFSSLTRVDRTAFRSVAHTLQLLHLADNLLQTLDEGTLDGMTDLGPAKYRFRMSLAGNPWRCDCALLWLQEMLRAQPNVSLDQPLCGAWPRQPISEADLCESQGSTTTSIGTGDTTSANTLETTSATIETTSVTVDTTSATIETTSSEPSTSVEPSTPPGSTPFETTEAPTEPTKTSTLPTEGTWSTEGTSTSSTQTLPTEGTTGTSTSTTSSSSTSTSTSPSTSTSATTTSSTSTSSSSTSTTSPITSTTPTTTAPTSPSTLPTETWSPSATYPTEGSSLPTEQWTTPSTTTTARPVIRVECEDRDAQAGGGRFTRSVLLARDGAGNQPTPVLAVYKTDANRSTSPPTLEGRRSTGFVQPPVYNTKTPANILISPPNKNRRPGNNLQPSSYQTTTPASIFLLPSYKKMRIENHLLPPSYKTTTSASILLSAPNKNIHLENSNLLPPLEGRRSPNILQTPSNNTKSPASNSFSAPTSNTKPLASSPPSPSTQEKLRPPGRGLLSSTKEAVEFPWSGDFSVREDEDEVEGSSLLVELGALTGTLLLLDSGHVDGEGHACVAHAKGQVSFRGVRPASTYTLCLLTEDAVDEGGASEPDSDGGVVSSPFDCRALTTRPERGKRPWLLMQDQKVVLGVGVAVSAACGLTCAVAAFLLVRAHPHWLRGNRRVVVVKHREGDRVLVLPSSSTSSTSSTSNASMSSSTSCSPRASKTSYVSAVEPTSDQLKRWRREGQPRPPLPPRRDHDDASASASRQHADASTREDVMAAYDGQYIGVTDEATC